MLFSWLCLLTIRNGSAKLRMPPSESTVIACCDWRRSPKRIRENLCLESRTSDHPTLHSQILLQALHSPLHSYTSFFIHHNAVFPLCSHSSPCGYVDLGRHDGGSWKSQRCSPVIRSSTGQEETRQKNDGS
jgi:hypothetical protein